MRTKSAARKEYIVFMNNDTLLYWHKLENFYPYILEEQHNEKIKSFKIARECDYPDLENPTIQENNCVRYYEVYLGIFRVKSALDVIAKQMNAEKEFRDDSNETSCFCKFRLKADGKFDETSFRISSFPWAINRVKQKQIELNQWDDDFHEYEKRLFMQLFAWDEVVDYEKCRQIVNRIKSELSWNIEFSGCWMRIDRVVGEKKDNQSQEHTAVVEEEDRQIDELIKANDLLNSFYVRDLENVINNVSKQNYGQALEQYLNHNSDKRIDVEHDKDALFAIFDPKTMPYGKWPSGYSLRSMQQLAVNIAMNQKEGYTPVFSVNGPPGTGKTLLAKAVAGEAHVPFFSLSGSDFVEMFVGVGASRVRDLFEEAKKNAPCIVFIDEIDAVARRRGTGMGGGHDEREQTLNQMLVEMDGFGVNEGIIVMAATNRVDILDPAIMRPGRFDRKVYVGRPDIGGREEILAVHAKNKPLGDDVDLKQIAQTTAGFTGADLENLLNEAAIVAAKENRAYITQNDIKKSFVKVGIGAEKKSRIISDKEKRITAFHEAGHAILFHVLPDVGPVYSVSIIPTGAGAAGYTMPLPEKDEMFNTKGKMLQDITVSLGGRVAEELVFDDITTGASQDIKQATKMAKAMVTRYGMSENVGLICYDNDDDEVFIGRDLAHTRGYGEGVATAIDQEVKRIIDECYAKARQIITENRSVLDACAKLLLEKEKISQKEFEALFETDHVVL